MTEQPRLHHLLDRMLRGVLLPAEREQLAALVGELEAHAGRRDRTATHRLAVLGKRREQIRALEAEVARLTAELTDADGEYDDLHSCATPADEVAQLRTDVARLTAGQCTHALAVCEQHHAKPVDGCPYPRCIAARKREADHA